MKIIDRLLDALTRPSAPGEKFSGTVIVLALLFAASYVLRLWQYGLAMNDDGSLYLYTALIYQTEGAAAAFAAYDWPFYSLIIAQLDSLVFDNLILSAWTLNFFFQAGQVVFIYKFLCLGKADKRQALMITGMFVFSTVFYNFRPYIMRDQGFLLCALGGIYFSSKYLFSIKYRHLLFAAVSLLLGSIFRSESVLLLLVALFVPPLLLKKYRFIGFISAVGIVAILLIVASGLAGNFYELLSGTVVGFINKLAMLEGMFASREQLLREALFEKYWYGMATVAMSSAYSVVFVYYMVSCLSVYALGLFFMRGQSWSPIALLIAAFSMVIIAYCFIFSVIMGFLVFRYNLLFSYMMVLLAFYLLFNAYRSGKKWSAVVLCLFLVVSLADVVDKPKGSKRYLREAQSVLESLEIDGVRVYSNAKQISIENDVGFKEAERYSARPKIVFRKAAQPLREHEAVVFYGYKAKPLILSPENCIIYQQQNRKREISLVVAKETFCQELD